MATLMFEPTETAQWQRLISDAEVECDCQLSEQLQSYLVFMLMRFLRRPDMVSSVLALDFLKHNSVSSQSQQRDLRDVGDKCLLFAGFFPGQARRRLVRITYFIDLGRTAYYQLSETRHELADVYAELVEGFVVMMDVLQTVREMDGRVCLEPLEAIDLWQNVDSQKAYQSMQMMTDNIPVQVAQPIKH